MVTPMNRPVIAAVGAVRHHVPQLEEAEAVVAELDVVVDGVAVTAVRRADWWEFEDGNGHPAAFDTFKPGDASVAETNIALAAFCEQQFNESIV